MCSHPDFQTLRPPRVEPAVWSQQVSVSATDYSGGTRLGGRHPSSLDSGRSAISCHRNSQNGIHPLSANRIRTGGWELAGSGRRHAIDDGKRHPLLDRPTDPPSDPLDLDESILHPRSEMRDGGSGSPTLNLFGRVDRPKWRHRRNAPRILHPFPASPKRGRHSSARSWPYRHARCAIKPAPVRRASSSAAKREVCRPWSQPAPSR